jgi:nitroreductase
MAELPHPKSATPDHDILDVIRDRWSPRAFDPLSPVSDATLARLFEAARWAPSSGNEQPWRFVVVSARRSPAEFAAFVDVLTPRNQLWAKRAPVLVLLSIRTTFERHGTPNTLAWYDAGQAIAFLSLQATAIGLGIRQMQGFDIERARAVAGVPDPFEPAVVVAIGRPGDPAHLEADSHRAAERQPRQRRPIDEFVFTGTWGRAFDPQPGE